MGRSTDINSRFSAHKGSFSFFFFISLSTAEFIVAVRGIDQVLDTHKKQIEDATQTSIKAQAWSKQLNQN